MTVDKSKNLIATSLRKPTKDFLSDVGEIGIDSVLELIAKDTTILKDLPIVKWIFTSLGIKSSIVKCLIH